MSVLTARPGISWQTLLADLSLILFMVTGAAVADSSPQAKSRPAAPKPVQPASPRGEPIAIWRPGGAAPALQAWLRNESPDPRQQLTIAVHYPANPGALLAALARAAALVREAESTGVATRLVVEPGADEVVATLAYDRMAAGTGLAPHGP